MQEGPEVWMCGLRNWKLYESCKSRDAASFFRCTSHQEFRIVSEKLRSLAMTCCARKANWTTLNRPAQHLHCVCACWCYAASVIACLLHIQSWNATCMRIRIYNAVTIKRRFPVQIFPEERIGSHFLSTFAPLSTCEDSPQALYSRCSIFINITDTRLSYTKG
jgi:hypothetical protein